MKIGTWLMAMMQPLIAKILVSLGFSVVSIVGMDLLVTQLKDMVVGGVNSLPPDLLAIFLFSGCGVGLGIIFGAIATKLMLWQIQSATRILGVNPQ